MRGLAARRRRRIEERRRERRAQRPRLWRSIEAHRGKARCRRAQRRPRAIDHGPGVPEAELKRIFEPFYRTDKSRDHRQDGQGIGLAITARVMELHGGTVTAANRAEGGLEITLSSRSAAVATAINARGCSPAPRAARGPGLRSPAPPKRAAARPDSRSSGSRTSRPRTIPPSRPRRSAA